jgi:Lon protease-like protein
MSSGSALTTPGIFDRLPIFPLPNVQLFPHSFLPLHVFEPRYRELVRDCLAGDHLMALALLEPGYETSYHERPAVRAVCGVGRIIAHESLAEGRSNIVLRGLARVRIVEELAPDRAYRVVRAQALDDCVPPGGALDEPERTLRLLSDQIAARVPSGETLRELTRGQAEPGALTDVLAAALVTDPGERQALLEDLDVARRLETMTMHLGAVLARMSRERGPAN